MSALIFWVLLVIWLMFIVAWYLAKFTTTVGVLGNALLLFSLFALLGWQVFGSPVWPL